MTYIPSICLNLSVGLGRLYLQWPSFKAVQEEPLQFHGKTEQFFLYNPLVLQSSQFLYLLVFASVLEPVLVIQGRKDLHRYGMQMPGFTILFD